MATPSEFDSTSPLPDEMPVMVLPDCHLFPGCLLPLYIYEERYRKMLAHVLGSNRIFCIGNREGTSEDDPISPYSTAGLVRACVRQDDGTSHLLLLGLHRIKILDWIQEKPFRIARVETVQSISGDNDRLTELKTRVLELFAERGESGQQLRSTLADNDNMELVCDVLSYHFTRCPKLQQKLLAEQNVENRFELIIQALEKYRDKP